MLELKVITKSVILKAQDNISIDGLRGTEKKVWGREMGWPLFTYFTGPLPTYLWNFPLCKFLRFMYET